MDKTVKSLRIQNMLLFILVGILAICLFWVADESAILKAEFEESKKSNGYIMQSVQNRLQADMMSHYQKDTSETLSTRMAAMEARLGKLEK